MLGIEMCRQDQLRRRFRIKSRYEIRKRDIPYWRF
jgi:hypothetical protein